MVERWFHHADKGSQDAVAPPSAAARHRAVQLVSLVEKPLPWRWIVIIELITPARVAGPWHPLHTGATIL
jgi:hypothetical protein